MSKHRSKSWQYRRLKYNINKRVTRRLRMVEKMKPSLVALSCSISSVACERNSLRSGKYLSKIAPSTSGAPLHSKISYINEKDTLKKQQKYWILNLLGFWHPFILSINSNNIIQMVFFMQRAFFCIYGSPLLPYLFESSTSSKIL